MITYYFPDGIASEHNNFTVTGFKEINSETFSLTTKTSKSSCVNYYYDVIEIPHKCYSGNHSGASEADNCDGNGSLPYSTYHVVAYFSDGCGEGTGGGNLGSGGSSDPGVGGGGSGSGGGGPVDTGISLPPPCQSEDCDVQILANEINDLLGSTLDYEQLEFLFNNNNIAEKVKNFLKQNNSLDNKKLALKMINAAIIEKKIDDTELINKSTCW